MLIRLFSDLAWTLALVVGPLLIGLMVVGFLSGVLQASTSVQDHSLGQVPRLIAGAVILTVTTPWMVRQLGRFTMMMLGDFVRFLYPG